MLMDERPISGKQFGNESNFGSVQWKNRSWFNAASLWWGPSETNDAQQSVMQADGERIIQTVAQPLGFREQRWEILSCA